MPPTALAGATHSRQSLLPNAVVSPSLRQSEGRQVCQTQACAVNHCKMVGMPASDASSKRGDIHACSIS